MKSGRLLIIFAATMLLFTAPVFADTASQQTAMHEVLDSPPGEIEKLKIRNNELGTIYAGRDYKPAWNFSDNEKGATAFIDSFEHLVDYHGLPKSTYSIDAMRSLAESKDEAKHVLLDALITASLLRLAHDLHGDSYNLDEDYPGWNFHRAKVDIPALLAVAIANNGANEFILGLMPKNPTYGKLAAALKSYRAYADKGGWPRIDPGPSLKPNTAGPRILQLRARLIAEGYLPASQSTSEAFDDTLQEAIAAYQKRNGLEPDGHAGEQTVEALNVTVGMRIEQIEANMERWRHMPDDFPPKRYTRVNIADANILIVEDGKDIYTGPVVVGKTDRKTPFIQSNVRSMIVNPSWHVPASIARKDILPKLRKDPHYLEKLGIVITGHSADPHGGGIDWASMSDKEFNFKLRQEPGDQNSLGHLKFDFDNDFAVYMHGTPHQELFAKARRNFSSGCIRLRDPDQVGVLLLQNTPGHWDTDKIQSEIDGGKTRWVAIKDPMPIYVLYWTVFIDDTGAINFRKDVYGYDSVMEPGFVPVDASTAGQ